MMLLLLSLAALSLAALPALLFLANLGKYRQPPLPDSGQQPRVSVLIPARDEERSIGAAVESALASRGAVVEVVVLDDHSRDGTPAVVERLARTDERVRLEAAPPLPSGWCGKQHACAVLARLARHDLLLFLDADVCLEADGVARLAAFLQESKADLVSGVPRQKTGSLVEKLVIPLIHWLLLGFLPLGRMRQSRHPAYAAGCGQLFLARRAAYERAGGHEAIRTSLHDGLTLPRAFRRAGLVTDLCDATGLACCRMYRGGVQVWKGLAKNAHEGLAAPRMILPATLLLLGGQVLPFVLLALLAGEPPLTWTCTLAACLLAWLPRGLAAWRFRQSLRGALLHPVGVALLVAIQWYALVRRLLGRPTAWKGRTYEEEPGPGEPARRLGAGQLGSAAGRS